MDTITPMDIAHLTKRTGTLIDVVYISDEKMHFIVSDHQQDYINDVKRRVEFSLKERLFSILGDGRSYQVTLIPARQHYEEKERQTVVSIRCQVLLARWQAAAIGEEVILSAIPEINGSDTVTSHDGKHRFKRTELGWMRTA